MTLKSQGDSQDHKIKETNDESDISNQTPLQRMMNTRRLPRELSLGDDDADAKSKITPRPSTPKNILNLSQDVKRRPSSLIIANKIPHNYESKITRLCKTLPPEEKLPLKQSKNLEKIPSKPIARKYARGLSKLNCSLPLLNKKVYIDDWSAAPRNHSLPMLDVEQSVNKRVDILVDSIGNNKREFKISKEVQMDEWSASRCKPIPPISDTELSPNSVSIDSIANSTATSDHYESNDLASLSVSSILNDSFDPSDSKILPSESTDIASSFVPLTPLNQTIDPTISSVAVSSHDDSVDSASISTISISDVDEVDSAPNLVANRQFSQTYDSKTEAFVPASNFVALTDSRSSSIEAIDLDPTSNSVTITPADQTFKPIFNSSGLTAHTPNIDSSSISDKREDIFNPASKPAAHTLLEQDIKRISSSVASVSIASLLHDKSVDSEPNSIVYTPPSESCNSEPEKIASAPNPIELTLADQSFKSMNNLSKPTPNAFSVDLASIFAKSEPYRQSSIPVRKTSRTFKPDASTPIRQNAESISSDSAVASISITSLQLEPVNFIELNQITDRETKSVIAASKPAKQEQSINLKTKNDDPLPKLDEANENNNAQNRNKNIALKSVKDKSISQNISNVHEPKNLDILSKTVKRKALHHSPQKIKKVKAASKLDKNNPLNQSINMESTHFDLKSKLVENAPHDQGTTNKTKKSNEYELLNVITNKGIAASKSVANKTLAHCIKRSIKDNLASKLGERLLSNQTSNSEIKSVDVESKLGEYISVNQNCETKNNDLISKTMKHNPFNQSIEKKIKTSKIASTAAENTQQSENTNFVTETVDLLFIENPSLNQKIDNEAKDLDSGSKSVQHDSLCQIVKSETKQDKLTSGLGEILPLNQNSYSENKNVDAESKLDEDTPLNQNDGNGAKNGELVSKPVECQSLNQSVKLKAKKAKITSTFAENTHLSQSINFRTENFDLPYIENPSLNQTISPLNQSINSENKNVDAAFKPIEHSSLDQNLRYQTEYMDIVTKPVENKLISVLQKMRKVKTASKSAENMQLSQSYLESENVNSTFRLSENTSQCQSSSLKTKNIDWTSNSTERTTFSQCINTENKIYRHVTKFDKCTPQNQSFQPMFNSSALTSNSENNESASTSLSSISCSQSSCNPDPIPFVSSTLESISKRVAHLPNGDTASTPVSSITRESRNTGLELKANFVALNLSNESFDPHSDATIHVVQNSRSKFDTSDSSIFDTASDFGNESFEPKANNIAHTRDLASITTLSITCDDIIDPTFDLVAQTMDNDITDPDVKFGMNKPSNHSLDPDCNITEPVARNLNNEVKDNTTTHTTHNQSSNYTEPRTRSNHVFDRMLNHTALAKYNENFGNNLITYDIKHTSQNLIMEPAIEFNKNVPLSRTSSPVASLISPETEGVDYACVFDNHSSKNNNDHHEVIYLPTPQNYVFHSELDVINELSPNQSFYTASDSVAKTSQNQSHSPIFNSFAHIPHDQIFNRTSDYVGDSLHSEISHPIFSTHTSDSQSFRSEFDATHQNSDSDPNSDKPLTNIQHFFSQFKSAVSLQDESSNSVSKLADFTPPSNNASRFAKLFSRDRRDVHPTLDFSSLTRHSQNSESKPCANELAAKIQKFNSIPNIVAPPQYFKFDTDPDPVQNAQQKLSRALGFNEQPSHDEPDLATPRSQDPITNFIVQMAQNPNFVSEPDLNTIPSIVEKLKSMPDKLESSNNQHPNTLLQTTEHYTQNNKFYRAHSSNEQVSQNTSRFDGFVAQSRGFGPVSKLGALNQNIENFESTVNIQSFSATSTSSSSNKKCSFNDMKPKQPPLDSENVPKFTVRVEESRDYKKVSSFDNLTLSNEKHDSSFQIPHGSNYYLSSPVTYLQSLRDSCSMFNFEPPTCSNSLPTKNRDDDMAHHFEGLPQQNENFKPRERSNLNTMSSFKPQPSQKVKMMPPPGFPDLPPPNQKFNSMSSFLEHLLLKPKFDSPNEYHQQIPQTQSLNLKPNFFEKTLSNSSFDSDQGYNPETSQGQNLNLKPSFYAYPPPNQNFNSPHDFHHQPSQTLNLNPKPDFRRQSQVNRNFDLARDFNQQPSNDQTIPTHNENVSSTPIFDKLLPNIQKFFSASNPASAPFNRNFNPTFKTIVDITANKNVSLDFNKNNNLPLPREKLPELQSLEYYSPFSPIGFPTTSTSNLDPNPIIDQICKSNDIDINSDYILGLEYGFSPSH